VNYLGLEHEFEEILEKGVEKGIVKAVEKIVDKGVINEIVKLTINTIEQEILRIIGIGVIALIASNGIENSIITGAQKTIQEVVKASKEATLKKVQDILINLIKNKYGDIRYKEYEKEIRGITDIEELSSMVEKGLEFEDIDDLLYNFKNPEQNAD
jgi:hypothetical protein